MFGGSNGGGGATGGQQGPVTGQGTGIAQPGAGLMCVENVLISNYTQLLNLIRRRRNRTGNRSGYSIGNL